MITQMASSTLMGHTMSHGSRNQASEQEVKLSTTLDPGCPNLEQGAPPLSSQIPSHGQDFLR